MADFITGRLAIAPSPKLQGGVTSQVYLRSECLQKVIYTQKVHQMLSYNLEDIAV